MAPSSSLSDRLVIANPTYSFDAAIRRSIDDEDAHCSVDLGPIDTLDPEVLQEEYDLFFGTSPLSSPSHTPPRSCCTFSSAATLEHEYDLFYGTSPLSSPPDSPIDLPPPLTSISPVYPADPSTESQHLGSNSKTARNKRKGRDNRRRRRKKSREQRKSQDIPNPRLLKHIREASATETSYDTHDIPSASSGFVAIQDRDNVGVCELDAVLDDCRFKLIEWKGRSARAIVDREGRVIAVLAGRLEDRDWDSVHQDGYSALLAARAQCIFPPKARLHRRGRFFALSSGISFGGGQKIPGNLKQHAPNDLEIEGLLQETSFIRMAGFASSAFRIWAPKLYDHYANNLNDLLAAHPHLRRNFVNSIWSAATFNFGPQTCAVQHRDSANLPYGWCSVTAMGAFDPTKGGHLVLWDLGLVIEFPPGSTILIPSAAISHSNVAISSGETRCSFTQYTAGGLFRWVAHGFKKDAEFFAEKTPEDLARISAENEARCKLGLSLFSTLPEVEQALTARFQAPSSSQTQVKS